MQSLLLYFIYLSIFLIQFLIVREKIRLWKAKNFRFHFVGSLAQKKNQTFPPRRTMLSLAGTTSGQKVEFCTGRKLFLGKIQYQRNFILKRDTIWTIWVQNLWLGIFKVQLLKLLFKKLIKLPNGENRIFSCRWSILIKGRTFVIYHYLTTTQASRGHRLQSMDGGHNSRGNVSDWVHVLHQVHCSSRLVETTSGIWK